MPKYYDDYGNEISVKLPREYYDDYGNRVTNVEAVKSAFPYMKPPVPAELKARTDLQGMKPTFVDKTVKTLGDWTPAVAGLIAELSMPSATTPAGAVARTAGIAGATALGSVAQQASDMMQPQFAQRPVPPNFTEVGKRALFEGLVNALGTPLQRGLSKLPFPTGESRMGVAKALNPNIEKFQVSEPEVSEFLKLFPNFKPTVGQLSNSTAANILENIATPLKKREVVAEQQGLFKNIWDNTIATFGHGTPEAIAKNIKAASEQGLSAIEDAANSKYTRLFGIGRFNRINHYFKDVDGPVYLDKAADPLDGILKRIKEIDPDFKAVADADKPIIQALNDIGSLKYPDGSIKPVSIEQAIRLKSLIGDKGKFSTLLTGNKKDEVAFRSLNKTIDEDILRSINGSNNPGIPSRVGWKGKTDALNAYKEGNALTEKKYALFGKGDVPEIYNLLSDPVHTIANVHAAAKDPEVLDRLLAGVAFGDPAKREVVRKSLASNYLQNLLEESFNKEVKQFTSNTKPLDWFTARENQAVIRRLFTNSERKDIGYLFSAIQHFDPKLPMAGVTAAGIRGIGALATFVPGTIAGISSGDISRGVQTSGAIVGVLIGANAFSRAVLLNPKVARAAANLMRLPPQSAEAKWASNTIFAALKGQQVQLMSRDGAKLGPGTVDSSRKVVPNFQFGEQQGQSKENWPGGQ